MKIDQEWIKVFRTALYNPLANKVVKKQTKLIIKRIHSYNREFDKYLPIMQSVPCKIILSKHIAAHISAVELQEVVASQEKVIAELKLLQPDIIGYEGFSDGIFSVEKFVKENDTMDGFKSIQSARQFQQVCSLIQNDPAFGVVQYMKYDPKVLVLGVEDHELNKLFFLIGTNIIKSTNKVPLSINPLYQTTGKLRGLCMIKNLIVQATKFEKKNPALPIGYMHEIELREAAEKYNFNWEFISAF